MAVPARPYELSDATDVRRAFLELRPGADDFWFFRPLLEYWEGHRSGRIAPGRADIDPVDLPTSLLPHILLVDVSRDPLDFRYRLAGTAADTIHGQNLRGVRIRELQPEAFSRLLQDDLERMAEEVAPQFVQLSYTNRAGKIRQYRVLRLPLCDADGRLEMVLILADHGTLPR